MTVLGRLGRPSTGPFTTARGLLPITLLCLFLFALPIAMLAVGAFRNAEPGLPAQWSFDAFRRTYVDPATYETLRNSVLLSTSVTILSTATGVILAFLVTRTTTPLRRLVTPAMVLVIALPPLFYAISWGMLGNPRIGPVNTLFQALTGTEATLFNVNSWTGLILVSTAKSAAFGYILLLGPFLAMDRSLKEAAQAAGAGRMRTLLGIDVPVLAPALTGVLILNFVIGLEYFDVPLFLGVPAGISVFSTQIYGLVNDRTPADYGGASALSLLIVGVVIALVLLQWRLLGNRRYTTVTGKGYRTEPWDIGGWRWAGTAFILGYLLLALVLPFAQLIQGSLQPFFGGDAAYSLINYQELLDDPSTLAALRSTFFVAVVGGLVTMALALLITYAVTHSESRLRRVVDLTTWLPWAVPGVVLALGIAWVYVSIPGLRQLYATVWIVALGLIVAAMPIATRSVQPALTQIGRELEEAARIGGASARRMFAGIVLPLIAPSFLAGWFVVAIVVSGNLAIPIRSPPRRPPPFRFWSTSSTRRARRPRPPRSSR
ncbi:MAG: ABC transporter permease subunit [Streptosporangiales bacterium]|nr:ABC transporter permease subunit [Streptosporangiales bacterium]